jgi:hypothetical protein
MVEDIHLRYQLKQRIENYNKDQKSLYINSYVTKIVIIILFLGATGIFLFFFIPLLTPLMLKPEDPMFNALSLTFSGCMISVIIIGAAIYFFKKRKDKEIKIKEATQNEIFIVEQDSLEELARQKADEMLDIRIQHAARSYQKGSFFNRFINLFRAIKDIILLAFSVVISPVKKPAYLYLDESRLKFSIWLIRELEKRNKYSLDYKYVLKEYSDYSQTWIQNTLNTLNAINVVSNVESEEGHQIILLNLDFYNPAEN